MSHALLWLIISHPYVVICREKYRELLESPKALLPQCIMVLHEGAKAEKIKGMNI